MNTQNIGEFSALTARLMMHVENMRDKPGRVQRIILDGKRFSADEEEMLNNLLIYLGEKYQGKKRLLGVPSVLHPMRAGALLLRLNPDCSFLDLLVTLLHDFWEDIEENSAEHDKIREITGALISDDKWFLGERMDWLTRKSGQTYFNYMQIIIQQSRDTPELMRVKLVDRLDNLLDMRLDDFEMLPVDNFPRIFFRVMWDQGYQGFCPSQEHLDEEPVINGADRLYQLYKSAAVLSLIRQENLQLDDPSTRLFKELCLVGMREAMRIFLHIFGYHWQDYCRETFGSDVNCMTKIREILENTREYAMSGGLSVITKATPENVLDGFFLRYFDAPTKAKRLENLQVLYANKELMIRGSVAFVIIYHSFLSNPNFKLDALTQSGIKT